MTSTAPAPRARAALAVFSWPTTELTTRTGTGLYAMIYSIALSPSITGIFTSMVTRSGLRASTCSIASRPLLAVPTTMMSSSFCSIRQSMSLTVGESSATNIRTFFDSFGFCWASMISPSRGLRDKAPDSVQQILLIKAALYYIGICASIHSTLPIVIASARGNHDNRSVLEILVFSYCRGQFKTIHARHLDICNYAVWWILGEIFNGVFAINGSIYQIACCFQDVTLKFADYQ